MSIRDLSPDLRRQITLLSCASFASTGSARIADPLLPQLATEFGLPLSTAAWAVSAFALTYGLVMFIIGPLGDRYGKYRVLSLAVLVSVMGGLVTVSASSFAWLVAGRVLTGLTIAAAIPLSMAWIGDQVPYQQRQPVLAYFLSGQLIGMIGGQLFGGFFADITGWRGAFWFMLITYVVVGSLLMLERRRCPNLDAPSHADSQSALSQWQRYGAVFQTAWARKVFVVVCCEGAFVFGGLAMIPSYLNRHFHLSLAMAGACVAMFGLGGFCYTSSAKKLLARLGEHGLALTGGVTLGTSFLLLAFAPHWVWAMPAAAGVGLGYYMLHNTLQTNATQMTPAHRGTAVGLFASFLFIGQMLGVWLASTFAEQYGFAAVFMSVAILLPLVGGGFALMLRRK